MEPLRRVIALVGGFLNWHPRKTVAWTSSGGLLPLLVASPRAVDTEAVTTTRVTSRRCLVPAPAGDSHARLRTRWCAIAGFQLNHSVRHMGRWLSNRGRYVPSNSSTLAQLRCAGAKKRYMWSWQTSIHVDAWRKAEPSQDIVSGAKEQRSNTAPVQTHNRRS